MVEVFKTNVQDLMASHYVIQRLQEHFPNGSINFDLEDCDRILRCEDAVVPPDKVILLVNACDYQCEVLL